MSVRIGAERFSHTGSTEVGVLLCHGFTGTPQSMRPWGDQLAQAGFSVAAPRLPGHGTTWQEMNRTTWPDWYGCVRAELIKLLDKCESVFVFGQSMGGTLTLRLAQEFGDKIDGIALVNPSVLTLRWDAKFLPILGKLIPSVKGLGSDIAKAGVREPGYLRTPVRAAASLSKLWRLVRQDLPKVTQPVLLAHSTVDHVVEPINSSVIAKEISSTDFTEVLLENSFHVATLDNDAPLIFEQSLKLIDRVRRTKQEKIS